MKRLPSHGQFQHTRHRTGTESEVGHRVAEQVYAYTEPFVTDEPDRRNSDTRQSEWRLFWPDWGT